MSQGIAAAAIQASRPELTSDEVERLIRIQQLRLARAQADMAEMQVAINRWQLHQQQQSVQQEQHAPSQTEAPAP